MSIQLPKSHASYRFFYLPKPQFEMRWRVPNRAFTCDLTSCMSMLDTNGKFASLHMPPFNREHHTGQEGTERYKWGFINHAGAYITFVIGGCEARPFLGTFDGMPNFHSIQLALKAGGYSRPVIIGATYNQHDTKLAMPEEDYKLVFWEVLRKCGEKAGPVASRHNLAFAYTAADPPPRRSADIDWMAQAGDSVGKITKPCLMFAPMVYTKMHVPSDYGLHLTPRYWDYAKKEFFIMPGHETKGELMQITAPDEATCGADFADVIIGTTFEKNRLVMIGWMWLQEFREKAIRVLLEFEKGKISERLIMPYAATCWRPMIEYFKLLKGFDEAVAAGLLIVSK